MQRLEREREIVEKKRGGEERIAFDWRVTSGSEIAKKRKEKISEACIYIYEREQKKKEYIVFFFFRWWKQIVYQHVRKVFGPNWLRSNIFGLGLVVGFVWIGLQN
jgi:hypothetical protein